VPISEKTRNALRELGLTDYEAKAYLALIEHGALAASRISEDAGVPYSKIYETLSSLEKKGWVEIESGRPSKYYPKPPPEALEAVKLRLESLLKEHGKQVLSELQPVYEKKGVSERPDIWIIRGEFNVLTKLQETLNKTKTELMIAVPIVPDLLVEIFAPTLLHLKNSGVKIIVMTTKKAEKEILRKLSKLAEVRVRNQMFGGGLISDEKEVILLLGEDEKKPTLAIWSDHLGLAKFARDYFSYLWKDSLKFK